MGIHAFSGRHPETGELFHNLETSHGGWGASATRDGPGPFKTLSHGDTRDVPAEVQEALYPLRIEYVRVRTDSGGGGRFRGGVGLEKVTTALAPCDLQISVERTLCPPWGVEGGRDGAAPLTAVRRAGREDEVILKGSITLEAGDQVLSYSGGGGGFGSPLERAPEAVAMDVRRGFVSRQAAHDDYGVVLDDDGVVLGDPTRECRARLRNYSGMA
jgi:N-methylhydantoinase B